MSIIRYGAGIEILVVTKGHPFERDPFFAIFESYPDIAYSGVEQPAAQIFFTPERARPYDAYVLYDMPGIEFTPKGPRFHDPSPEYCAGFLALLEADLNRGITFLFGRLDLNDRTGARFDHRYSGHR